MNASDYTDDDDFVKGLGDFDAYGPNGENKLPEGGKWITGKPIVHIMTEAEIMAMPIIINDEQIEVF